MRHSSQFVLLSLASLPMQTAAFTLSRNVPFWIGNAKGKVSQAVAVAATIFQMTCSQEDDVLFIGGDRTATVLRNGYLYPFRIMPTALNSHLLLYPESKRQGLARMKPIQTCISGGFIKFVGYVDQASVKGHTAGVVETITAEEALNWVQSCDLVICCDYSETDWRLIRPLELLRQFLTLEQPA